MMRFNSWAGLLVLLGHVTTVNAEETSGTTWSQWTASAGLQMWRPMYAVEGDAFTKPTIGAVVKVNTLFNDVVGMHLRGAYGVHMAEVPRRKAEGRAFALGLGLDFHHSLGKKAQWSNTFGVGYGQSTIEFAGVKGVDLTSLGAYFVTTFDVTVWGPMGIWMDWGCQVVGPSFGSSQTGDISVWHINPLGAGGMRMNF
jgi:hypothetical protein